MEKILNKTVKITKIKDLKFEGKHSNKINEGFEMVGRATTELEIGQKFRLDFLSFASSTVISIDEENMTFSTKNSVYKIEF